MGPRDAASDACYDRGSTFRLKCFLNDRVHQPKIVGKYAPLIFFMILVVYLGHGSFHPVALSFFSSSISFWGEVLSSQIEEPQKESGAPPP